jgi:hypothetical protein
MENEINEENNHNSEPKLSNYTDEIKNGIFNLSISMCQHIATFAPMEIAKEQTAQWLEEIAKGLRVVKENPIKEYL